LRLNVIPELKKLNPSLEQTFSNNIKLFRQASLILSDYAKEKKLELVSGNDSKIEVNIKKLLKETSKELLLFEWLSPLGFNPDQLNQLLLSLESGSKGKQFYTSTHKALIDREHLFIQELEKDDDSREFILEKPDDFSLLPFKLEHSVTKVKNILNDKNIAQLDLDQLKFPLKVRRWKQGDRFQPLGMKGSKKVSDFFNNQKISRFEKEKIWILCDQKNIIWVIGWRIDERYKISSETKSVLKLKYLN
jgi:tRNA(Ile)-lysidine synthase